MEPRPDDDPSMEILDMTILSQPDPTAAIACTLPVNEAGDRLLALRAIIADGLDDISRTEGAIRVRIARHDHADLDDRIRAWAEAEKACCGFLGFAVESAPEAVTLEISAPSGAEPTLDGIEWIVRAAGRQEHAA